MDAALERIRDSSPELAIGGPNHAPMAADALISLGAGEKHVMRWIDGYRDKLAPRPDAIEPVTDEDWREFLGRHDRTTDWAVFFTRRLAGTHWQAVLRDWLPRLMPGMMAAGTHGLIRTAHAVRELRAGQTPLRLTELGAALGYWAAFYQELPGTPALNGHLDVAAAMSGMPRLGSRHQAQPALPREFVTVLDQLPAFPAGVSSLAAPTSVPAAITALTHAGAQLYLANAARYPLVMLHAVTGPAALRLILPELDSRAQQAAFGYAWQSVAAWVSAFSARFAGGPPAPEITEQDVIAACLETADVHSIKFAEACLREYRESPSTVYLQAAADWALRVRESRSWARAQRVAAGIAIRA